jgi:putative phosphoribosyl transferase
MVSVSAGKRDNRSHERDSGHTVENPSFVDRRDAGQQLAQLMDEYATGGDTVVLGVARGGVLVAAQVAATLNIPLGIMVVSKIGLPWHPEVAMGAICLDGGFWLDRELIARLSISSEHIHRVMVREYAELKRRAMQYPEGPDISGKSVLLIDDGIATGATMRAAIASSRRLGAANIIVGAPVGAPPVVQSIRSTESLRVLTVKNPADFGAVSRWYDDFTPTRDNEVRSVAAGALSFQH